MADALAYWARLFASDGGVLSQRAALCASAAKMFLAVVTEGLPESLEAKP